MFGRTKERSTFCVACSRNSAVMVVGGQSGGKGGAGNRGIGHAKPER